MNKNIFIGAFIILAAGIVIFLGNYIGNAHSAQIEQINKKFAPAMSRCWAEAKDGETCKLEYIYIDKGQTPVSAKVVKK